MDTSMVLSAIFPSSPARDACPTTRMFTMSSADMGGLVVSTVVATVVSSIGAVSVSGGRVYSSVASV